VEVRRAEAGDLAGVRAIAESYGNLYAYPARPDYLDFELEQDGLWVACDGGEVVGFAGVLIDGDYAHLADAFVRRDALGRGIGRALLDASLPGTGHRVTFSSADARALPLYARAGLQPLAPLLYLEGTIDAGPDDVGRGVAGRDEIVERDGAESGRSRRAALDFLVRAGAYGLTLGDRAYAIVRNGHVGPAAGDADELVAFAAAASAEHGTVHLALPGPHPALRPLLEAGLRITDQDTYMASEPGVHDLTRYVPDPDLG
jgi:GNAT superfamily N-acetyltransferase